MNDESKRSDFDYAFGSGFDAGIGYCIKFLNGVDAETAEILSKATKINANGEKITDET